MKKSVSSKSKSMPKSSLKENKVVQEIAAISLVGFGVLLFLALISFDPRDLDFYYVGEQAQRSTHNFIGPAGAWLAWGLIFPVGLAAFFVPVIMVAGGIFLMQRRQIDLRFKWIWFLVIIISGAGLLQLCKPFLAFVDRYYEASGWPGGAVGLALNDQLLQRFLGEAGAAIILSLIYLSGLVLLFEIRPIELTRKGIAAFLKWQEEQEKARMEAADPLERIDLEKKKLERQEKRLRRKLRKEQKQQSTGEPEQEAGEAAGEELLIKPKRRTVEPTIIDATRGNSADEEAFDPAGKEPEVVVNLRKREPRKRRAAPDKAAAAQAAPATKPALEPEPIGSYRLPSIDMLDVEESDGVTISEEDLKQKMEILVQTLEHFKIPAEPGNITRGATITRYEVYPDVGVRVEKISALKRNIARALKAERVNILAPIPGKDTVGVEVGNSEKTKVSLRSLFESSAWKASKASIPLAVGQDVYGNALVADLADMPHLLIGGSTGSGKSVCINCLLLSLLYTFRPDELKIILVDPKVVELQVYNDLPHLVVPVVTETKKVLTALKWVMKEMDQRYAVMAQAGVRNIKAYNAQRAKEKEAQAAKPAPARDADEELPGMDADPADALPAKLPYVVVIIDELADLMQTSPAEVELAIARLSAKARAAGIHLVLATQTPRAQVVTGVIKTNVPCRIAFQVPSALDSRVILDENGAENLLGKGDLLYLPPGSSKLLRAQGAFVSDEEVAAVVGRIKDQVAPSYHAEIHDKINRSSSEEEDELSDKDEELVARCMEVIKQEKRASTSLLQRRLRIGYTRASWVIDFLESQGILGPKDGAKDREILVNLDEV
jgi:S-DNA-T family DNA segregation ATPase FtsK/SpoIIIE